MLELIRFNPSAAEMAHAAQASGQEEGRRHQRHGGQKIAVAAPATGRGYAISYPNRIPYRSDKRTGFAVEQVSAGLRNSVRATSPRRLVQKFLPFLKKGALCMRQHLANLNGQLDAIHHGHHDVGYEKIGREIPACWSAAFPS